MSRAEIIAMANEAGVGWAGGLGGMPDFLQHFAALVAAKERDACAQVAMEFRRGAGNPVCGEVAAAIRPRGKP
jgi:hypothetical protein